MNSHFLFFFCSKTDYFARTPPRLISTGYLSSSLSAIVFPCLVDRGKMCKASRASKELIPVLAITPEARYKCLEYPCQHIAKKGIPLLHCIPIILRQAAMVRSASPKSLGRMAFIPMDISRICWTLAHALKQKEEMRWHRCDGFRDFRLSNASLCYLSIRSGILFQEMLKPGMEFRRSLLHVKYYMYMHIPWHGRGLM